MGTISLMTWEQSRSLHSTYQVRKMKIVLFLGILAVLFQHISCQCLNFGSGSCCFDPPTDDSCCFDKDQWCCVDNNGRCEGQSQGGGSCQQSTSSKKCTNFAFDGTRTKTEYTLNIYSDCSGDLGKSTEINQNGVKALGGGPPTPCKVPNCKLPSCN